MGRRLLSLSILAALLTGPAAALETDQYFAWGQPLEDGTAPLNARVNLEISRLLDEINGRRHWPALSCHDVVVEIKGRFRLFIFHDLELWASNSELIDRVPKDHEGEVRYVKESVYRNLTAIDLGSWVPPGPTISINEVRFGTDKLAHFFAEGWWYYRFYRKARNNGKDHDLAIATAINRGILSEKTILGKASSGVFSPADLEANYQGLLFLVGLCEGGKPALERSMDGWRMTAPFDFRDYVTPEWDESYQPNMYTKRLWKRVRPVIEEYCDDLERPEIRRSRESYRERDTVTLTERRMGELVELGKLPDLEGYSIENVCAGD
jgi:hypothetical protein